MDESEARIGAYRIHGRLGSGGMGEVFLAYDARLRRHVAIKRLRHDVEMTPERRRRFRREARAAAGLNHPAIVQVHDILEHDEGDCIVMEYVEGRTLDRVLAAEGVDAARAVELARQVADGLAAAHERGVVHRDLKAENVMVTSEGRVRILDFGLAKPPPFGDADDSLTHEGAVLGTLRAMSPEQAAGAEVDARSDLYSLGVLLYEMLTGRSPFTGEDVAAIYRQITAVRPTPPGVLRPELPAALSALVEALLEKDPGRRPRGARQVTAALAELAASPALAGLAPSSSGREATPAAASDAPTQVAPPPARPAPAARRRRPRGWAIAAGLASIAAAVGAYVLASAAQPRRVAVLRPEVAAGGGTQDELAVLGVQEATLATLRSLRGLEPLDPSAVGAAARSAPEAARAAAADEVLAATLERRDGTLWIALRRVDASGESIWSSGPFEVVHQPWLHLQLAEAVSSRLRRGYPGHRPRPGVAALDVRDEDYAAYLELQRRPLSGVNLRQGELDELETILRGSPRFLSAYVLAAEVARTLRQYERARGHLERAAELAPGDPRVVARRAHLEIDAGRLDEAAAAVAELQRRTPAAPAALAARALLLERRGQLRQAVDLWRRIVAARPSWQHLWELAAAETRVGDVEEARVHLGQLLAASPGNLLGLARLAYLELVYGDLDRAEELYRELIGLRRERSDLTNLGTVFYLRGRYEEAARTFRQALEVDPGSLKARVNLADAELAAGRGEAARALYQALADELRENPAAAGGEDADPSASMVYAQCLARLGDLSRAVEVTRRTLKGHPENGDVHFLAALVYALADDDSALASARAALALGVQARWFEIPGFDSVRAEPGFAKLLASPPARREP